MLAGIVLYFPDMLPYFVKKGLLNKLWNEQYKRRRESALSRLDIKTASKAQTVVDRLYKDMERRIASSPPGLCPIDMSLTFLQLCHAQSCG